MKILLVNNSKMLKISIDTKTHYDIINMNKYKKTKEKIKKMQKLETVGAVHTHTHTEYFTEINNFIQKISIWLFSNVLFLHTKKSMSKIMYC